FMRPSADSEIYALSLHDALPIWMLGWDHRWGFLEHRFVREGRVLGIVAVRGVFKGPNGTLEPKALLSPLGLDAASPPLPQWIVEDRKSTRLNSSHVKISYAVFCL